MGKDRSMYILTKFPKEVNKLGNIVHGEMKIEEEGPPKVELLGFELVSSIWVHIVMLDDTSEVLYQRKDKESEFCEVKNS